MPVLARRRIALTAGLVMIAAGVLVGTQILPSNAANPVAGSTYTLVNAKSSMCLDVPGASRAAGARLQQWGCTSDSWQQFRLVGQGPGQYWLQNVNSGQCVDVPSGSKSGGARLQQWGCSAGQTNQLFTTKAGGSADQLVNVGSGLCVSVRDGSVASGAEVVQDTCTTSSRMQWTLAPAGSGGGGATPTATASSGTATVAADGTGRYKTVQAAIDAVGPGNQSRVTITIKPGTYREIVTVPKDKPFVSLAGTGSSPKDVLIVNNHSAGDYGTSGSATAFVNGADFAASNLTFSNDFDETTRDSGQQAVALDVNADRAVLSNVRVLGDQDTLLITAGRSYFTGSYVEGTVDFVFGGGTAVFDASSIYEKRTTGGPVTAAKTDAANKYGFLIYKSDITGATADTTQLGRPWGPDGQVLVRESTLSATVRTAQPWTDMSANSWKSARFLEYKNTGAGATANSNRPQLSAAEAAEYTPQKYLAGRTAGTRSRRPRRRPIVDAPGQTRRTASPLRTEGRPGEQLDRPSASLPTPTW
jgi:pectinesterase